ncbi:hypothetical protein [Acinetobacter courvalinii]|uniref:hypothetical protein n=1 Tax=Acinetobacter courvalinii TaxID=280147 RepID=UPI0028A1593A|nr:hypothetical protein [Acinetobacter courvalinii]
MQSALIQLIIALFGFSLFGTGLKYIFSPHYRLLLNKKKFKEKQLCIENLHKIYQEQINPEKRLPPFVLDAQVNSCLGTNKYDHRLIFLLIKGNFASIEQAAKAITNAWPLLDITYPESNIKITQKFALKDIERLRKSILYFYLLLSLLLISLIWTYQLFGSHSITIFVFIVSLMSFCIWIGSSLTTILSIERILDNQ